MKFLAFVLDVIVLIVLVGVMILISGDAYIKGGILTKVLLMGLVGGVYGFLRSIYRGWLLPKDKEADK